MKKRTALLTSAFLAVNALLPVQAGALETNMFVLYGKGKISENAANGQAMTGNTAMVGIEKDLNEHVSIGALYYNEGHPEAGGQQGGGHRDGPAAMIWLNQKVNQNIKVALGAGPYFTMNTTTVNGKQIDDKRIGALVALAVTYHLYGPVSARLQYTRAQVPGSFNSDSVMGGVQIQTDAVGARERMQSDAARNIEWSVGGGVSQINLGGSRTQTAYQVEALKPVTTHVALSVSAIRETDRTGVASQVWYRGALSKKWTAMAGAGPYIAHEDAENYNGTTVNALLTVRIARDVTKTVKVAVSFDRVVSPNDRDSDIFMAHVTYVPQK
jgi:hypothetical protein